MSKHWRPEPRTGGISGRDVGIMTCAGLAIGLIVAGLSGSGTSATGAEEEEPWRSAPVRDPWAESRRSQAILRGQEASAAADAPVFAPSDGAVRAQPAAVRIVDGDTFWYGGIKIRVADIDTPEVHGRCAYETQLAARATARMASLLAQGPFELERIDRDEDRYGRKLRVVIRGGRSLGDQLVSEGLARTWSGRREPWCS